MEEGTNISSVSPVPAEPSELVDFDKRLVEKIKGGKLSPKPRWYFFLKNSLIWVSGAATLVVGAAAVAVTIYLFRYNDWEVLSQLQQGFWEFLLLTLPYFWLIFLLTFVSILYFNLRHTPQGYRYPAAGMVGVSVLASIFLGSVFYAAGWGEKIDNALGAKAPLYAKVMNRNVAFWQHPEDGRLAGVVVGPQGEKFFTIRDLHGREWQIFSSTTEATGKPWLVGQAVHMVGERLDNGRFQVKAVRPTRAGRAFLVSRPRPPKSATDCVADEACGNMSAEIENTIEVPEALEIKEAEIPAEVPGEIKIESEVDIPIEAETNIQIIPLVELEVKAGAGLLPR